MLSLNEIREKYIVTYPSYKQFEHAIDSCRKTHGKNTEFFSGSSNWNWIWEMIKSMNSRSLDRGKPVVCINYKGSFISPVGQEDKEWVSDTCLIRYYDKPSPYINTLVISALEDIYSVPFEDLWKVVNREKDPLPDIEKVMKKGMIGIKIYGFYYPNVFRMSINKRVVVREFELTNIEVRSKSVYYSTSSRILSITTFFYDPHTKTTRDLHECLGWRLYARREDMDQGKEEIRSFWLRSSTNRLRCIDSQIKEKERELESLKREREQVSKDIINMDDITSKILDA